MLPSSNSRENFRSNAVTKIFIGVLIQTITHRIQGKIQVNPDDALFKDEMNRNESFLTIKDATIFDEKNEILQTCQDLSINRQHIVWICPQIQDNQSS